MAWEVYAGFGENLSATEEIPVGGHFGCDPLAGVGADELSESEALIMTNRSRDKTTQQKGEEYKVLKYVAEERARLRQVENAKRTAAMKTGEDVSNPENFPDSNKETGEARDIAAAKIGMSGKTAEKIVEVLESVEILKEEGKTEAACVPGTEPGNRLSGWWRNSTPRRAGKSAGVWAEESAYGWWPGLPTETRLPM